MQFNKKITDYDAEVKNAADKINKSADDLNSKITYVNVLLDDANKLFNTSVTNFNTKKYETAKENFTETKTKYIEVTNRLKSDYVNKQLDKTDLVVERPERIAVIVKIDIQTGYKKG